MTGSTSATSLPLSLLLAATRLTALHDPGLDVVNGQSATPLALSFPAAYAEYVRLLTSAKATAAAQGATATGGRVWGRDVSREAWEKLVNWGLVVPLGSGNGTTDGTMFRVEISFEEVADLVSGGGSLGRWWRE
jgi:origin recognition complex subunit 4